MRTKHPRLHHPDWLVVHQPIAIKLWLLPNGNLGQSYVLHDCPHNGQTTGFRREGVNLVSPLLNIAKEAWGGIGTPNVAVHHGWKSVKRQKMLTRVHRGCGWLLDNAFGIWLIISG
jgi:hypothetical protein